MREVPASISTYGKNVNVCFVFVVVVVVVVVVDAVVVVVVVILHPPANPPLFVIKNAIPLQRNLFVFLSLNILQNL